MSTPQIDQQYSQLCTQEGDLNAKIRGLEKVRDRVRARIDALNAAADELKTAERQEQVQKAQEEAAKAFADQAVGEPIVNPLPPE